MYEEDTLQNIQLSRTKGGMNLGPIGNLQGGYKCTSLSSGKKIIRRSWDAIPISDEVITRVNVNRSNHQEQLIFTDWRGRTIRDVEFPGMEQHNGYVQIPE